MPSRTPHTPVYIPLSTDMRILRGAILTFATLGSVTGLIIGLIAYPPTAPVAALELGIPVTVLGTLLAGVAIGIRHLALWCIQRRRPGRRGEGTLSRSAGRGGR